MPRRKSRALARMVRALTGRGGNRTYDAVVIGGGPAGYVCSIRLGQLQQRVLCIENEEVGGVCLNWGCVPSKAIIETSHAYAKLKAGGCGLKGENVRVDANELQDWKEGIVRRLTGGVRLLFESNRVDLTYGEARVIGPRAVRISRRDGTTETVEATKAVVIATGATAVEITALPLAMVCASSARSRP